MSVTQMPQQVCANIAARQNVYQSGQAVTFTVQMNDGTIVTKTFNDLQLAMLWLAQNSVTLIL